MLINFVRQRVGDMILREELFSLQCVKEQFVWKIVKEIQEEFIYIYLFKGVRVKVESCRVGVERMYLILSFRRFLGFVLSFSIYFREGVSGVYFSLFFMRVEGGVQRVFCIYWLLIRERFNQRRRLYFIQGGLSFLLEFGVQSFLFMLFGL